MKYCTVCKAKYEDSVSFCPVDGEVLEDDPSSIVDTVLDGQYQIESMLGKGGMGAVYRARHILLGDRVAIKVLPREVRNNAEWLRRFRREGQAARRFRHPNSVTVYDLRTAADGVIYMVMEYVEGHTLDAELKLRGSFTPAEALDVLGPIISVLNTAHSMGVVHRDLKPENIMIGKATTGGESAVKLLDLGIAKMREIAGADNGGTTALTMAGQVLGTPYYMSPEQWGEIPRDGNPEIDGRADIYSLGLVFYEMIAGRRPCSGTTLSELRRAHVSVTLKPLQEAVPGVPTAFSAAIAKATAKDRNDRQATASEFGADLLAAVNGTSEPDLARTLPDIPHAAASSLHTAGINPATGTKSDLEAPTIITIDGAEETGAHVPTPTAAPAGAPSGPKPPPVVTPAAQPRNDATVIESPDMASSITVQQTPRPVVAEPVPVPPASGPISQPVPKKSGLMLFVGIGAIIVVLIVLGVGGVILVSSLRSKGPAGNTSTASNNNASNTSASEAALAKNFGNYWLEVLPSTVIDDPVRVAGVVPLASGQSFKFHFEMTEDGYIYIIGPGQQNQPTAFLTEKPASISGVSSNRLGKGSDFSFPSGIEHWLQLDKKPGTENYTIIFSPTPLSTPGFLKEQVTGEPLSQTEQAELGGFLAQNQAIQPTTELNDKTPGEPFMQVKIPKSSPGGNPIIFQIRIQHK